MGIYIPGMEMPRSCRECPADMMFCYWCGLQGEDADTTFFDNERRADCPLVQVPPHGDLIDRTEAIVDANERAYDFWSSDAETDATVKFLQEQISIIPAEEARP